MNNLSVNCFENDQDEGKGWKWISQSLQEWEDKDPIFQSFLEGGQELTQPKDDYFESLVERLKY